MLLTIKFMTEKFIAKPEGLRCHYLSPHEILKPRDLVWLESIKEWKMTELINEPVGVTHVYCRADEEFAEDNFGYYICPVASGITYKPHKKTEHSYIKPKEEKLAGVKKDAYND